MQKRLHMKIKYILLASIFFTAFSACDKECEIENEEFDQTDLMWFSYQIGDKLIYINDSADLDTFEVSEERIVNVSDASVGFSERQCYLPIQGSYRMENNDSTFKTLISLTRDKRQEEVYSLYFSMNNMNAFNEDIDTLGNMMINGVEYNDVFMAERDPSGPNGTIDNAKFNKKFGLIQYTLKDGTIWTLDKIERN